MMIWIVILGLALTICSDSINTGMYAGRKHIIEFDERDSAKSKTGPRRGVW